MFKYLAKFLSSNKTKNIDAAPVSDLDKDIILINVAIDTKTEEIGLFLDAHPYNIEDKRMVEQAEKFAHGLYLLCGDKAYFTKLVLDNIDKLKKKSTKDSMFYDNVIFFWNHYLNMKNNNTENDPVIKPSKVFKNT